MVETVLTAGRMQTVLTAGSQVRNYGGGSGALAGAQQALQARAEKEAAAIEARYAGDVALNELQSRRWERVKDSAKAARDPVGTARQTMKSVLSMLDALDRTVVQATLTESDPTAYAATFRSLVDGLRDMVERGAQRTPLLRAGDTLEFRDGIYGTRTSFAGSDLGVSYHLEASDGSIWRPDDRGSALVHLVDGEETERGPFDGGLRLDAKSGDSIDFTAQPNTASPVTVSGATLVSGAMGLLDAWLYGDLATQDDRDAAATAIGEARAYVKGHLSRVEAAATLVDYTVARADLAADTLRDTNLDLRAEQTREVAALQERVRAQASSLIETISAAQGIRARYADMLGASTPANKLFSAIYKINA